MEENIQGSKIASAINHEVSDLVLTYVKAGVNPLLVGPAGCGKTTVARNIAKALDLPFYYTGAVESAFQLRGFTDAQGRVVETAFVKAYREGGIFLLDEMDGSDANALLVTHAALDNGIFDTPAGLITRHPNLHFIAAANTWGHGATLDYMGRNHLDAATLDRFVTVPMDYDQALEQAIIATNNPLQQEWPKIVHRARAAARELSLHHVISTRACVDGAKLLDAQISTERVVDSVLLRGLASGTKIKVLEAIKKDIPLAAKVQKDLGKISGLTDEVVIRLRDLDALRQEIIQTGDKAQAAVKEGRLLVASALELTTQLDGLRGTMKTLDSAARPLVDAAQRGTEAIKSNGAALA